MMGNLSITASQVLESGSGNQIVNSKAYEDVVAGEVGYYDAASGKWKLEGAAIDTSNSGQYGVFLNTADAGQPVAVLTGGDVDVGAAAGPVVGEVYMISPTSGKICPAHDALLGSGKYIKVLGVGAAANVIKIQPHSTDQQVP